MAYHPRHYLHLAFSWTFATIVALFAPVISIAADFGRLALRLVHFDFRHLGADLRLIAHRVLRVDPPEYRCSYDTHGLSLDHRMRN